jgi:hypothetical protein
MLGGINERQDNELHSVAPMNMVMGARKRLGATAFVIPRAGLNARRFKLSVERHVFHLPSTETILIPEQK